MAGDVVGWLFASRKILWTSLQQSSLEKRVAWLWGESHCSATVVKSEHNDGNSRAEHALWWLQSQWPSCWWTLVSPEGSRDNSNVFIWCHANMLCPVNATALCRRTALFKLDSLVHRDQSGLEYWLCANGLALCRQDQCCIPFLRTFDTDLHGPKYLNFYLTSI